MKKKVAELSGGNHFDAWALQELTEQVYASLQQQDRLRASRVTPSIGWAAAGFRCCWH